MYAHKRVITKHKNITRPPSGRWSCINMSKIAQTERRAKLAWAMLRCRRFSRQSLRDHSQLPINLRFASTKVTTITHRYMVLKLACS